MSEELNGASGTPPIDPVGDGGNKSDDKQNQRDSVAYSTYQKTLAEAKKAKQAAALYEAKIAEYEAKQAASEEQRLKEEGNWKELAEAERRKAEEAANQLKTYQSREVYQTKVSKILGSFEHGMDSKWHHLINDEAVKYDPATGEFDDQSVQKEVERIRSTYPEAIAKSQSAGFKGDAPQPNGGSELTVDQYARLSKDEKKKQVTNLNVPDWMKTGQG